MTFLTKSELRRIALKNTIQEENLDVSGIKVNDTLNPKFFNPEGYLDEKIKNNLLKLVEKFISHVGIDQLHIKDIVMTGSLANYNYNEQSDVDVHILSDLKKIDDKEDILVNFFKEKKDSWANKYDITIYGHPVEMYVEDYDTAMAKDWVGMYSLVKDEWLKKPDRETKVIDYETLDKKSSDIADSIDKIIIDHKDKKIDDKEALKRMEVIKDKIKAMRDKGLNQEHSEFALENLIFKVLRNNGYLDKMNDFKKEIYHDEFTINEKKTKKVLIIKESQYKTLVNKLRKHHKHNTI
jgi:predicted nucleotidyltransferase